MLAVAIYPIPYGPSRAPRFRVCSPLAAFGFPVHKVDIMPHGGGVFDAPGTAPMLAVPGPKPVCSV